MNDLIHPLPLPPDAGDLALLLRVTSAANRSASIDEIAAQSLDIIERRIPFDTAFFMLVDHARGALTIAHPVRLAPDLHARLQKLPLPSDFFSSVRAERYGVYALSVLSEGIRKLLAPEGYSPIILSLQAEERAIGVLTLARHGDVGSELYRLFLANKDLLDGIAVQLSLALQRAQLSEQLRASEAKYRGMIEHSPDGIWELDMSGKTTFVNQGALDIVGYSEQEARAWSSFEVVTEDREVSRARWFRLMQEGVIKDERIPIRAGTGEAKTLSTTAWLVRDAAGNPTRVQMVMRDVTPRAEMEGELRRRNQELHVLNQIGILLSRPIDIEGSLDAVCEQIIGLTGMDAAVIFALDEETGRMHLMAGRNISSELIAEFNLATAKRNMFAQPDSRPANLFETVIREKRSVLVQDMAEGREWASPVMISAGLRSGIAVPLRFADQIYGILAIGSQHPRVLGESDTVLIETIGLRVALRIRNRQLFDQMQRQVSELRALAQVGEWLAAGSDSPETLARVVELIKGVLAADGVNLYLRGEDGLDLAASCGTSSGNIVKLDDYEWEIWAQGPTFAVPDTSLSEVDAPERERLYHAGISACIAAPLISGKGSLGFLLINQGSPRTWRHDEQQLAATFARQIASNLDNIKLLRETRARVNELEALSETATLAGALIDEDNLIELALVNMQELLSLPVVSLHMLSGDRFLPRRMLGGTTDQSEPLAWGPESLPFFERRQPIIQDARHRFEPSAIGLARLQSEDIRAFIAVPLMTATEPLGMLVAGRRDEHIWTRSEIRSVQTIANQMATAIANARLYREQIERARRLALLAELSQACSATLHLQELLSVAVEKVQLTLGAAHVSLRLVQDGMLNEGIAWGNLHPELRPKRVAVDPETRRVLMSGETVAVRDMDLQTPLPAWVVERTQAEEIKAILSVPLVARGESLGLLRISMREVHNWTPVEVQFAETVANTVAVSISNAQLFESLQQERRDLSATLDSVFSGVLTTDTTGRITNWNRAAARMTNYTLEQVRGRNWTELAHLSQGKPDELIFEAMAEGKTMFGLMPRTLTTANGREIPLAEAAAPLRDSDGQIRGAVAAFWDRSQEHAAERARLDFVLEVSHELRNSLTAIIPMAELLRDPEAKAATRERATGVIAGQVERLHDFTKRFLAFEQDQYGLNVEEQTLDLTQLVQEMTTLAATKYPEVKLVVTGKAGMVYADRARLETVLLNLLDNACKFSPAHGKVTVACKRGPGAKVSISIGNQSSPIPSSDIAHIFERGYRGQQQNGQVDGTGIGLWLVQAKLREMGGEIRVINDKKPGVTFVLAFHRAGKQNEKSIKNPGGRRRPVRSRRPRRSA